VSDRSIVFCTDPALALPGDLALVMALAARAVTLAEKLGVSPGRVAVRIEGGPRAQHVEGHIEVGETQ